MKKTYIYINLLILILLIGFSSCCKQKKEKKKENKGFENEHNEAKNRGGRAIVNFHV